MSDLISRSALLKAMDGRYKEKKDIVQDNLAEGFAQMEKLIKEQPRECVPFDECVVDCKSCWKTKFVSEALLKRKLDEIVEKLEWEKSDWNDNWNIPINRAIKIVKGVINERD